MRNVGIVDRIIRAVVGILLIAAPFALPPEVLGPLAASGGLWWLMPALGLVALATAAFRFCPLYSLLGIRTCRLG